MVESLNEFWSKAKRLPHRVGVFGVAIRRFAELPWIRALTSRNAAQSTQVVASLSVAFAFGIGIGVLVASFLHPGDADTAISADRAAKQKIQVAASETPAQSEKSTPHAPYAVDVRVRTTPSVSERPAAQADAPKEAVEGEPAVPAAGSSRTEVETETPVREPKQAGPETAPGGMKPAVQDAAASDDATGIDPKATQGAAPAVQISGRPKDGASENPKAEDAVDHHEVAGEDGVLIFEPEGEHKAMPTPKRASNAEPVNAAEASVRDAPSQKSANDAAAESAKPKSKAFVAEEPVAAPSRPKPPASAAVAEIRKKGLGKGLVGSALAALPVPSDAAWIRNAVSVPPPNGKPMIALVIDDVGINQRRSGRTIALPGPLTLSFIPYGYNLRELTGKARENGHELLVHLPMEPLNPKVDPGPNALLTNLKPVELQRRLDWALEQFDGYVGINNHMGSKFTVWPEGMRLVMQEVHARGLLFLDSWTNNGSLGYGLSRQHGVPGAVRDVFIDHDIEEKAITRRLQRLERLARRRGFAVGIAHPYDMTLDILSGWIVEARKRGIRFVPISAIVRRATQPG